MFETAIIPFLEDFAAVFDKLKPVLEDFINQKNQLEKQIKREGTVPVEIRKECVYNSIVDVRRFDEKSTSKVPALARWIADNKIVRLLSDGLTLRVDSRAERVEGKKPSSHMISTESQEITSYVYDFDLEKFQHKEILPLFTTYKFQRFLHCDHLQDLSTFENAIPLLVTRQMRSSQIGGSQNDDLMLFCRDCEGRIENTCSELDIRKDGPIYISNHSHDQVIMRILLRKYGIEFEEPDTSVRYERRGLELILPKFNGLITDKKRELDDRVEKLKPSLIIALGQKSSITNYLGMDCNVILFDDSPDALQRFAIFDKSKAIEQDEEKCCQHIVQNLDAYVDELRGKDHDRIIESLGRIGRELGFVSQREVPIKGSKVDLVWMQRDGSVFGAIEVETVSSLKKDIISTWELEPKLAIIVGHFQTDKFITDMLDYVLLKSMPHRLLLVNNTTKKAYFIYRQELLKVYDLRVSPKGASDVAEL